MLTTLTDVGCHAGHAALRVRHALQEHGCQPRGSSTRFRARCPVHESRGLTLSVSQGRVGALMHCFAQCANADILAAIGCCWDDLFDEPRARGQARTLRRPDPLSDLTEHERRFLRGLDIFVLRESLAFASFVADVEPVPWQERVRLAEDGGHADSDAHYWRTTAKLAALASDEQSVRRAHAAAHPDHAQHLVLMTRTEDLERERARGRAGDR
jgi:hypothetical protein